MASYLLIVAPDQAKVYETVKRGLGTASHVELIVDRRAGRSARPATGTESERKQIERRRARIDDRLRRLGWVLVPTGAPTPQSASPAQSRR